MEESNKIHMPMYSFIPKPLEIEGKPHLSVFPYNVMIMRYKTDEAGNLISGTVIYTPDFETYQDSGNFQSMQYPNSYGPGSSLLISYDKSRKSYACVKYLGGESIGTTVGGNWNLFFQHVGILGIAKGETCEFELVQPVVRNLSDQTKAEKKTKPLQQSAKQRPKIYGYTGTVPGPFVKAGTPEEAQLIEEATEFIQSRPDEYDPNDNNAINAAFKYIAKQKGYNGTMDEIGMDYWGPAVPVQQVSDETNIAQQKELTSSKKPATQDTLDPNQVAEGEISFFPTWKPKKLQSKVGVKAIMIQAEQEHLLGLGMSPEEVEKIMKKR